VFLLGVFNGCANAATGPLYVLRTADADRGRTLAAISGVSRAGSVVALGLGGLVGGWLGARATFVGGAVLALLVVGGLSWSLRGVDDTPPLHDEVRATSDLGV
jgi:predicted MFS family arabinose efflux permease